jgi:uncharacterized alpha-E superfamily protein
VLESPGLSAFWPGVARRLLGEELLLPAHTSWWCGEASVWAVNRRKLREFVIVPTFSPSAGTTHFAPVMASALDSAALRSWEARIDTDPAAYTLLAPVRPSELPVWREGRLEPRPVVVRVFAMSDGEGGWRVLPGGLTRVGNGGTDAYLSMQAGSASTDTWVLTEGPVDATTLLPRPLEPSELVGWHRVITSRAAENLFWLGRYTERAENSVRLARLTLEALPAGSAGVLQVMHRLLVRHGMVPAAVPMPAQPSGQAARVFERTLIHSMGDPHAGASVAFNLRVLRGCAEALRERLSTEHWGLIKHLSELFPRLLSSIGSRQGHEPLSDVLTALQQAALHLAAITGAQTDRMTRDDGWRLLSVARQIERLDMLAHALATGFEVGLTETDDGFALLLGLFDSTITYRAQFQARREVPPLLHLLVLDTDNPRSLAWVARTLRERLRKLARHDPAWAEQTVQTLPRPEDWSLDTLSTRDAHGRHTALLQALRSCSSAALDLSNDISRHLFSHAHTGPADRTLWQ